MNLQSTDLLLTSLRTITLGKRPAYSDNEVLNDAQEPPRKKVSATIASGVTISIANTSDSSIATASNSRASKTNLTERRKVLEDDSWAKPGTIEEHRMVCGGCNKLIKLEKKVKYALKPWQAHKMACRIVTGKVSTIQY